MGQPTGRVEFKAAGTGSFSSDNCDLSGAGPNTSVCSVDYTPEASGAHQLTSSYGGDAANTPGSGNFVLTALP